MHGVGKHPSGHDDEQHTGDLEEGREVEVHGPPVDQIAEQYRHGDAEQPSDGGVTGTGNCLIIGPEEQCGLESLPTHSRGGEHGEGHATAGDCRVHLSVEVALDGVSGATHPEDHPGEEHHGEQRHRSSEGLLGLVAERIGSEFKQGNKPEAGHDGGTHADPDGPQMLGATGLDQIGHEDAYDE